MALITTDFFLKNIYQCEVASVSISESTVAIHSLLFSRRVKYSLPVTFSRTDHCKQPLSDEYAKFTRLFFTEHCKFTECYLQGNSAAS